MRQSWSETFRALGSAVLSLVKAELAALERDLARSGKSVAVGAALLGGAAAFGFWTLGVATYFLIQLVALWLPLWAASLVVTALFAAVAGILAAVGLHKLKSFENPLTTARRRLDDHVDWWQSRLLEPPAAPRRQVDREAGGGGHREHGEGGDGKGEDP